MWSVLELEETVLWLPHLKWDWAWATCRKEFEPFRPLPLYPNFIKRLLVLMVCLKNELLLQGEDVLLVGDFTGNWKDPIKATHKGGSRYEVEIRLTKGK